LDAACVKTTDGRVVIILVNRHPGKAYRIELKLEGMENLSLVSCEIQQGEGMNDVNTPFFPEKTAFAPYEAYGAKGVIKLCAAPRAVIALTLK
jgi:alpha-L-arabinofuranosidase